MTGRVVAARNGEEVFVVDAFRDRTVKDCLIGAGLVNVAAAGIAASIPLLIIYSPVWYADSTFEIEALLLGLCSSQPVLTASWSALGPGRLTVRMFCGAAWTALCGVLFAAYKGEPDVLLIFALLSFLQWLVAGGTLWGLAAITKLRLVSLDNPRLSRPTDRQFSLGSLMILTAAVAGILGLCRWLLSDLVISTQEFYLFLVPVLFNAALALLAIFTLLRRGPVGLPWMASILGLGAMTAAEAWFATWILAPHLQLHDALAFFGMANFTQHGVLAATLWFVRGAGYRLMRVPRVSPPAPLGAKPG